MRKVNNNVIFIVTGNPYDLTIAVKVDRDGYYSNYKFIDAEYGRDAIDYLNEAKTLQTIEKEQIPSGIEESHEWSFIKDRFVKAYIHKNENGEPEF